MTGLISGNWLCSSSREILGVALNAFSIFCLALIYRSFDIVGFFGQTIVTLEEMSIPGLCNNSTKEKFEEFEELFQNYPLYSQENESDPLVVVKLFDPCGSASWFLLEYDPVERIAFGYVVGMAADELGYVSLAEMESIERLGIGIEQDIYFQQKRLSEVKK